MNKITMTTFVAILLTTFLNACEFSQSISKDLNTGAVSRGDGLQCDAVTMMINEDLETRNTFVFGEKVTLVFNDIKGFKKESDKIFPGISLYVVKNKKDTVQSYPNLLSNLTDGTDIDPLQLQAKFVAALPHKNQEHYKAYVRIWDNKGDGSFTYEMPFKVEEGSLLGINSTNAEYSNIYLWNASKKQVVIDKNINQEEVLMLFLEGIHGLENKDGKVYPIFSVDLEDSKGNKILSNPNLLSDYEETGVGTEDFADGQISAKISFTNKGKVENPCILKATLRDKISSNKIEIHGELEIN